MAFFRRASSLINPNATRYFGPGSGHHLNDPEFYSEENSEQDLAQLVFYSNPNSLENLHHAVSPLSKNSTQIVVITETDEDLSRNPSLHIPAASRNKERHYTPFTLEQQRKQLAMSLDNLKLNHPEMRKTDSTGAPVKAFRPWFIWTVSLIQVGMLIYELVLNNVLFGQFIQTTPSFNILIGPNTLVKKIVGKREIWLRGRGSLFILYLNFLFPPTLSFKTLVQLGARYSPCIKTLDYNSTSGQTYQDLTYSWPAGMKNSTPYGTLSDVCGMGGFGQGSMIPNQWWRFITAIFLHGGVVHLLLNFVVQLRAASTLEQDIGSLRIGTIYMSSGIIGYIFSALFSGVSPSTGASGALYGK